MKFKIFRANQIAMLISLLVVLLTANDTIIYKAGDALFDITLIVMIYFVIDATSNFLKIENDSNSSDETLE